MKLALTSVELSDIKIAEWGSTNFNDPKFINGDWRDSATDLLLKKGYELRHIYNPDMKDKWDAAIHPKEEDVVKNQTLIHFFFISKMNRSTVSVAEAVAAMALGWNVVLVMEDFDVLDIRGQQVTTDETNLLNKMRGFLRSTAVALGYRVYATLEDGVAAVPVLEKARAWRGLTSAQKKGLKNLLQAYGFGYLEKSTVINISEDPFKANIETLCALVAAFSSDRRDIDVTIIVPDMDAWKGKTFGTNLLMEGRRFDDFKRILDPYLEDLSNRAAADINFVRE